MGPIRGCPPLLAQYPGVDIVVWNEECSDCLGCYKRDSETNNDGLSRSIELHRTRVTNAILRQIMTVPIAV